MARRNFVDSAVSLMCVLSVCVGYTEANGIQERRFVPSEICGSLKDLIDNNCTTSRKTRSNNSSIECAIECNKNTSCLGSMLDDHKTCHHLHICDYAWDNMNCQPSKPKRVHFPRKECQNDGRFTSAKEVVCECKDGWIGSFCDRKATKCEDMSPAYGYKTKTKYFASINTGPQILKIMCKNGDDTTMLGIMCNNGRHQRSYSWWEYQHGHFIDWGNYWIGLENMNRLTNRNGSNLVKWILYFKNVKPDGSRYETSDSLHYHGFKVHDESLGFSYHFDKVVGNYPTTSMVDCLNETQGVPFSTYDKDNDLEPDIDCAELANAGWWFKTCNTSMVCNPLGMSVNTLPPPVRPAHIAIKGLDMMNSNPGRYFRRFEMRLFIPKTQQ